MNNQSFDTKMLLRITTKKEIINFKLGRKKDDYIVKLDASQKEIEGDSYKLSDFKISNIKGKKTYHPANHTDHYAIKRLAKIINGAYKIKQTSRDEIVEQVKVLLMDSSEFYVFKGDISDFYETADTANIISKILRDGRISKKCCEILKDVFNSKPWGNALPRGASISSPLSELILRDFDKEIKNIPGVYYYSRFVDDFIIFSSKREGISKVDIAKILENKNLKLNEKHEGKTKELYFYSVKKEDGEECSFDFLGYNFSTQKKEFEPEMTRGIKISLADKKINKIKTRIVKSLLAYSRDRRKKKILRQRLEFLTGNYIINQKVVEDKSSAVGSAEKGKSKDIEKNLYAGVYYSNKYINSIDSLVDLDRYLVRAIYSKGNKFADRIKLSQKDKLELVKNSFVIGFESRCVMNFNNNELKEICGIWRNE